MMEEEEDTILDPADACIVFQAGEPNEPMLMIPKGEDGDDASGVTLNASALYAYWFYHAEEILAWFKAGVEQNERRLSDQAKSRTAH